MWIERPSPHVNATNCEVCKICEMQPAAVHLMLIKHKKQEVLEGWLKLCVPNNVNTTFKLNIEALCTMSINVVS